MSLHMAVVHLFHFCIVFQYVSHYLSTVLLKTILVALADTNLNS